GAVFTLEPEDEERPAGAAEDSNDIYILPSGASTLASPPESPTTATASWQAEGFPVSLSSSQSWRTESPPVSLGPESWQQVTVDPEEVKSLDSNGAGEKSENNSSNSDIVHVEKEEIPEGAEAAAAAAPALMAAGEPGPEGPAAQVLCRVSAASQVLPCPPRPRVPRGPVERARPMLPAVPLVKMLPLVFKRTRRKRPRAPARDRGASLRVGKLEGGLAGLSRLLPALLSVHSLEPTGPRRPAAPLLLGIAVRDLD
ncbi:hypothetical protein E2I00_014026, partial [Balaenoptera physalus]